MRSSIPAVLPLLRFGCCRLQFYGAPWISGVASNSAATLRKLNTAPPKPIPWPCEMFSLDDEMVGPEVPPNKGETENFIEL
jgi:hypothetical protein